MALTLDVVGFAALLALCTRFLDRQADGPAQNFVDLGDLPVMLSGGLLHLQLRLRLPGVYPGSLLQNEFRGPLDIHRRSVMQLPAARRIASGAFRPEVR